MLSQKVVSSPVSSLEQLQGFFQVNVYNKFSYSSMANLVYMRTIAPVFQDI
jgi:hypothetical protein